MLRLVATRLRYSIADRLVTGVGRMPKVCLCTDIARSGRRQSSRCRKPAVLNRPHASPSATKFFAQPTIESAAGRWRHPRRVSALTELKARRASLRTQIIGIRGPRPAWAGCKRLRSSLGEPGRRITRSTRRTKSDIVKPTSALGTGADPRKCAQQTHRDVPARSIRCAATA